MMFNVDKKCIQSEDNFFTIFIWMIAKKLTVLDKIVEKKNIPKLTKVCFYMILILNLLNADNFFAEFKFVSEFK